MFIVNCSESNSDRIHLRLVNLIVVDEKFQCEFSYLIVI